MKNVKKIVIYAVIVIAVIGCAAVAKTKLFTAKKEATTAVAASKTTVEVQIAKAQEKSLGDSYKATLEAYQQGIVTSKIAAKVVAVSVENGQYVNAGDTIATLDDQDIQNNIKTAQAQVEVSEQQVNSTQQQLNSSQVTLQKLQILMDDAQRNYDRQKTLFDGGAISKTDLESAEKALNTSKADYSSGLASIESAKASIESSKASLEAQKVNLQKAQNDLANTVIKAPISGVISDKTLNVGQMASQGAALAKVNDISSVYATIQVPQEKITGVKIGQAATITVDGNDKTYDGTIEAMDSAADATTRVFNCKVKIDNGNKSLLPGIFGKVQLISEEKAQVITVPISALAGNEGDYSVFLNDNGTAKKQKITIGETNENNVEVTDGIKEGDQVICTNISTLQEGSEVDAIIKDDSSSDNTASEQDGGADDTTNK
ncbi:efflux RND transporter periplasmic adaptor subunit [Clostridium beijerinckii]|jgi:RND family efflux transporter, MFP subunit|uniref:Efflux RND transporter periplasmic adaptor subunit n=2 Tax=Clostridium beijerinckii TaxID=1520 RepID=A0AAE2RUF7_CLOBE|nr:efflux RND transporter periplasmic adaptor subunit [Clostridium beijerinckii]ABR34633.1 efflux transporter, RND family, MFP subunit [Clostridium beijerinckii NCIMB 8052]AIU04265.1 RND family efflux transporter MFP subunit [Clostridium beijerinckii ATCC 35702]MBF7810739.1 efflux RND transporter periplasmic adaptor subunit [Clostridium beijerinckii]NOW91463.1 multidrug efflux pump subunit AcrA (membrane-fusion protein) [Clostridium beijerinckii]NRT24023.1 multidrug efflux pump subunit AcrA (m